MRKLLVALVLLLSLACAHTARAQQTFSGPGLFIDPTACASIINAVDGQTWCFDPINYTIKVWNATVGAFQSPSFVTTTQNFNNFSIFNVGGVNLTQLAPPGSVAVSNTCGTGPCATTYTYEVTCKNDSGETIPSAAVTTTNGTLSVGVNFNVISWAQQSTCTGGYGVYGRVGGSLMLLSTVPVGTTTFTDSGGSAVTSSYQWTFTSGTVAPTGVIFDFSGVNTVTPIDVTSSNTGQSTAPKANSVTTNANHDLQVPVFAFGVGSGAFTAPGGFSNITNVIDTATVRGIWAATKDIAAAGATGAANGTLINSVNWGGINIALLSSNPAVAVTYVGSAAVTSVSPFTSLTLSDPPGTLTGHVELMCVTYTTGSLIAAPSGLSFVTAAVKNNMTLVCSSNLPTTSIAPPTTNTTGILSQAAANGTVYRETLLGLQPVEFNTANAPNGAAGVAQASTSFPVDMKVQSCRVTWFNYAGCAPFPTFAIKDTTAGTVLCSTGTVSAVNTDQAVTPTNFSIPANDVIALLATSAGAGCTNGQASVSMVLHE